MIQRAFAAALFALFIPCAAAGPATQTAPSPPSPLHDEIISDYMSGKWYALDATFKDKTREIVALPRDQAADITAIKMALAECRPPWWPVTKAGKKVLIHPTIFGRTLNATYDPDLKSSMQISMTRDLATLTVNWAAADMDNPAPGEHGFSKGELNDLGVFAILGSIESWASLPPAEAPLNEAGKLNLGRYIDFRGNIAGIAYGTPGGRRWGLWLFLDSYNAKFAELQTRNGRKAVACLFLSEILSHPEVYTSIEFPKTLAAENAEETLALALLKTVEKHPWTFTEDNALRAAAKLFANTSAIKTYTSGIVPLPNKLSIALDPQADKALQPKRDAWVKQQFDKLVQK